MALRIMTAQLKLPEKVLSSLLAGARITGSPSLPDCSTPLDDLYRNLRADLQNLFGLVNISIQPI